eukprot:TRINITY_DN248_c0_g1_i1.p1 TRINITY_DN248_c0_g1~~TRINITY_DN248_c0_g1_i1.p1  ORF type:complete len:212 (+),score=52.98 TRINITY_DN248_c0_g1_i1:52-687(+)
MSHESPMKGRDLSLSPFEKYLEGLLDKSNVNRDFLYHPITQVAGTSLMGFYFGAAIAAIQGWVLIPPMPVSQKSVVWNIHRSLLWEHGKMGAMMFGTYRLLLEAITAFRGTDTTDYMAQGVAGGLAVLSGKIVSPEKKFGSFVAPAVVTTLVLGFMHWMGNYNTTAQRTHDYIDSTEDIRSRYMDLVKERKRLRDEELLAVEKSSFEHIED